MAGPDEANTRPRGLAWRARGLPPLGPELDGRGSPKSPLTVASRPPPMVASRTSPTEASRPAPAVRPRPGHGVAGKSAASGQAWISSEAAVSHTNVEE